MGLEKIMYPLIHAYNIPTTGDYLKRKFYLGLGMFPLEVYSIYGMIRGITEQEYPLLAISICLYGSTKFIQIIPDLELFSLLTQGISNNQKKIKELSDKLG